LRYPKIGIDFVYDKAPLHVFQITLQKKGGGFFKFGDSSDKFLIKASTEPEMIDWVACLKQKIE
jgi:hypothetical protein